MSDVKRSRISYSLSLRVFIICSAFGLLGSILIYFSEQKVILDDQLKLLEEISSSYFREIDNDISGKISSAERANITVRTAILDKETRSSWKSEIVTGANGEFRADDGVSGAFSSSLQPMTQQLDETFHKTGEIWEMVAPLMLDKFLNFWIITNDNFVRVSPKNWALEIESDQDLKDHIYYRTGTPEENPGRIPLWSSVYFDSVVRSWMTSLIIPLYDGDEFIGVTGSDLPLNSVLAHLDNLENRSLGFKFLIFDEKNNLVLHPGYSLNIPGRDGPMGEMLNAENLPDKELADFIRKFNQGQYKYRELLSYRENGTSIKAFAYPLRLLNWRFVVYREERELRRLALNLGWKIVLFTMIVALGIAYLIRYITGKLVIKRITALAKSVERFKENRSFSERGDKRNDEVSLLSDSFHEMSRTINRQLSDLSKANRELIEIMESSTIIFIISTDTTGLIKEYNKGAEQILGYVKEEMVGINTPAKFHNEEEMIIRGRELSSLYGEEISGFSVFTYIPGREGYEERDWLCRRKDGRDITIHLGVTPIYGDSGEITGYLGMGLDITERKIQDRKLGELREYLISVINSISSPILAVNGELTIVQWNSAALNIFGAGRTTYRGCPVAQVLADFSGEMVLIEKAVSERSVQSRYRKIIFSGGRMSYWNILIYPLRGEKETGAVIHLEDVTESIHIEEMMIQSEKMLSVGGLAAGMAHEINNPLAGIMQTLEVMNRRLTSLGEVGANRKAAEETDLSLDALKNYMEKRSIPSMIAIMRESGKRIAAIVENMLSFARKSGGQYSMASMEELVRSSIDLALTDYDLQKNYDFKHIRIDLKCTDHIPEIPCEKNEIQQVLLNILQNGAQAMTKAEISEPAFSIECSLQKETEMVYIEISDNGPGMSEEIRKRVFEPFFTTKEEGVGTGLGLSVSYFIITENHRGEMSVTSTPGKGTTFKIGLPLHSQHDMNHDKDH